MRTVLTQAIVERAAATNGIVELRDSRLKGLVLRVQASGVKSYYCEYGRGKRIWLGRSEVLGLSEAREAARKTLATVYRGQDPVMERREKRSVSTYGEFLDIHYAPWAAVNQKSHVSILKRIRSTFRTFLKTPLPMITMLDVERWRGQRAASGVKPATINRDIVAFKASLNRAVDWGLIEQNPIARLKKAREDKAAKVRFLNSDEERRLREALHERDGRKRAERDNANRWRSERGYVALPDFRAVDFVDHLTPMVLLSLNTGVRRGELFALTWSNVDIDQAFITIGASSTKTSKTRHIPLNEEAVETLASWKKQCDRNAILVFENDSGESFDNVNSSWRRLLKDASIEAFRWHDMRHHFASRLAMVGVDLNTIRELLGHSDYAMTLRYAHLSPEQKRSAVALLNK